MRKREGMKDMGRESEREKEREKGKEGEREKEGERGENIHVNTCIEE